jgi:WD40-like Beta Propeller Repeat
MAGESGDRSLRPFPALDPEPPRRLTWRSVRWPAVGCVVAGAVAAVLLLTLPSSSAPAPAQARFAVGDGLVVFEQQPSGQLGTAAPDGSHRVMLTRISPLQGIDLPVASSDGHYLVNAEGQLVTMGPAGPTSVSNLADRVGLTAVAQASQWGRATFADGSKYVVATECDTVRSGIQSWIAHLIPTAGRQQRALGTITDAAGDPEFAGALVSAPTSTSAASSSDACYGPKSAAPDKALELLRPGQPPRTIVTAAALTGALGWPRGTAVQVLVNPSPDGSLLALDVAAENPQPTTGPPAREEMVVVARAGQIVADMRIPAGTFDFLVSWSPDGRQIAFCPVSRNARPSVIVWAVGQGQAARTIVLPGRHDRYPNQLLWSPDGRQLIYAALLNNNGITQADNLQRGWTVIDLRSGRVHDVTAPGQPAAWLPATATAGSKTR